MKKIRLVIIIIFVLILILFCIRFFVTKGNKDEVENSNLQIDNSKQVNIIEQNDVVGDFKENESKNENKQYIEMTWENYKKYNNHEQTFRIQDVTKNKNGTVTIKGRVYKYVDMPNYITKEQYQALEQGKALNILGEKVIKSSDENRAKEAGYDMALEIQSKDSEYQMMYYIKKNNDGSGSLHNGSEAALADGTDIYMQITLDWNIMCDYGGDSISIKDYYKKDYHVEDKNRVRLPLLNDEFVFWKGKCSTIIFSTV